MTVVPCGIYKIVNRNNGKTYVGQAKNVYVRKRQHFEELRRGKHHCKPMQEDFNNDKNCLEWSVVELCSIDQLNEREIYWINTLNCIDHGYNQHDHPYGRPAGATAEKKIKGYKKRS